MGESNKKIIILGISAGVLLITVITLACIFFFAPAPVNADVNSGISIPSSEKETSLEESSEPSSEEPSSELSSEEPSSEPVPEPSSEPPKPASSKPAPKPAPSSKPAPAPAPSSNPAPSSKPAPASSAPPPSSEPETQYPKLAPGSTEVKLKAGESKTYFLDVPDNCVFLAYPEDPSVTVSFNGREATIKTSGSTPTDTRIGIECQTAERDYVYDITLKIDGGLPAGVTALSADDVQYYTQTLLGYVNQTRNDYGLNSLTLSGTLNSGAQTRANEATRTFDGSSTGDHPRPDGSAWNTVYSDYKNYYLGEVLARGDKGVNPFDIFDGWMNSPDHRNAIMNPSYTQTGFGFAVGSDGQLYVAEHFRG